MTNTRHLGGMPSRSWVNDSFTWSMGSSPEVSTVGRKLALRPAAEPFLSPLAPFFPPLVLLGATGAGGGGGAPGACADGGLGPYNADDSMIRTRSSGSPEP